MAMGLFRRVVALAASTVTAVAVVGVVGTATASASTVEPDWLCVYTPPTNNVPQAQICAYAQGSNPIAMTSPDSTTTNWYFPAGGHGEIYQANTNNCMQVDAGDAYKVIEAQCNGANYQEWNVDDDTGDTLYWVFQSAYAPAECLSYNRDAADLYIGGCDGSTDWYQQFYPIPQSGQ
jgi:Ricin-type beta-trefoil lectin domain-like